ncbi:MAG: alpha/beta hydrolase [Actinomycetota bacterium]
MSITTPPSSDPHGRSPDVHAVLIPGYWLGAWAWGGVEPGLRSEGVVPHAVTLPGLDGTDTTGITLGDHVDAVGALVDALVGDVVLVAHSGGGAVAQMVIDRSPERIRRVIYVDAGPLRNGVALFPDAAADLELPSWETLAAHGSSLDGIESHELERFRRLARAHPAGVASAPVVVSNEERLGVPTSVVCTSLPSSVLTEMVANDQIPSELLELDDVHYVDLPTGHWPMLSRPADLAAALCSEIGIETSASA